MAVQSVLEKEHLLENVAARGQQLQDQLQKAFDAHPHVGDICGRGLFVAIELVKDKISKEAPSAELGLPALIKNRAMEAGLICYPGGGTADGKNGAHVLLAPPFIYTEANVDELVRKLKSVLGKISID